MTTLQGIEEGLDVQEVHLQPITLMHYDSELRTELLLSKSSHKR